MFVNKNLYRKYLHTFVVLLAMIISLFPITVKAKTTDYTPDKVLTDEMVKNMAGCEAEIKGNEIIIRPKNGASEGVISDYSKEDDFKALQNIFKKDETENKTLRFEGNIYGYGSLKELFEESKISSLGNIGKFNVSNVTDMTYMFYRCANLTSLEALKNWNVSNVTNMNAMFDRCANLTSLEALKDWNVSNVTNMNTMFFNCKKITSIEALKNWNVSKVTDMRYMFYACKNITSLEGLKNWSVSKVTNMHVMFCNCENITSLEGLKNWNVSNVKDMGGLFYECKNLNSLEGLNNWNVSNVTNMNSMFSKCEKITSLDALKNWNVSNVKDMGGLFYECKNLNSLEALKNWNVSNVTSMEDMFSGCSNLGKYNEIVDTLNAWNMSKVNDTRSMFSGIGDGLSLDKHKLILDFSNASIKKLSDDTFRGMYGILILNNKKLPYKNDVLKDTFLTVTNNKNYLNKDKDLKYYRDITLKYGNNKVKKISMPAVYDSKGSRDVYNIIKAEVDKKIKATINELNAEDPNLFLTGEYTNLSTLQEKTLALFGEYELKSQKKESETKVIKAKTKYEADETLPFGEKKVIKVAEDGQKKITITKTLKDGNWVQEGKPKEEIIKPVQDGLTKVGNKEVSTNGDETITKIYEVNPDTGALTNPRTHISRPIGSLVGSIKEVVIKANMKYEADETLPFNEKKVIKVAEDGKKKVQDTGKYVNGKWVKGTDIETIIKPVQDGLTKVGNKEVSTNGDETITKIYEVNPDTGALTNPKVTKTVKMARLVPAQHHNHNNQQTMSHTVDTSDHSSLSYYGMFLSALSVLCLILFKKEKLN